MTAIGTRVSFPWKGEVLTGEVRSYVMDKATGWYDLVIRPDVARFSPITGKQYELVYGVPFSTVTEI